MEIHPIPNHATLPDMPSATNDDHDGRYFTETEIAAGYVPYTGANATVDLGAQALTTTGSLIAGNITILDATPILIFQDSDSLGAASVGYIEWRDSGGGRAGFLGNHTSSNDDLLWKNEQGGNIGIETTGAGKFQIFANTELNDNSITGVAAITVTGLITTKELTLTAASGNNYKWQQGAKSANHLSVTGLENTATRFSQHTFAGTGVNNFFEIVGVGTVIEATNRHYLQMGWAVGSSRYEINVIRDGTSVAQPDLVLTTDGNANQIKLNQSDGSVSVSGDMLVGNKLSVNADNVGGDGLILNGAGSAAGSRGGEIEVYGNAATIVGYIFGAVSGNRLAFKSTAQSTGADVGVAWIDFDDGSASFAAGGVTIASTGASSWASTLTMRTSAKINLRDTAIGIYSQADTFMDLFADGGVRIGDSSAGAPTSFSKFEPDGTLEFNGEATVFEDIPISLSSARVPAANAPTWSGFIGNLNTYTYGLNDFQEFSTEIEHSYKESSDIEFHIHGATNGLEGVDKTIKFEIEYELVNPNTINGLGGVYTGTTTMNGEMIIPASTADKTSFVLDIGIENTGNFLQGASVVGRVRRIASTGTEPVSDPFVVQVGIHIEQDTVGSRTELTK